MRLSILLLLSLLLVSAATAQSLPWSPSTESLDAWEQVNQDGVEGNWSLSRGVTMQVNQTAWASAEHGWTALIGGNPEWSDMTMRATVKLHGEGLNDTVGLIFGWQDAANHWRVRLERTWTGDESYRVLEHVVDGQVTELARVEGQSNRDQVELTICVSDWHLWVAEDDRGLMALVTSDAPTGRVGLLSTGAAFASFRNIEVQEADFPGPMLAGPWISGISQTSATFSFLLAMPTSLKVGMTQDLLAGFEEVELPSTEPTQLWQISLDDLEPGHTYQIGLFGDDQEMTTFTDPAHGIFSITTEPANREEPFRLGVWGDNRTNPEAHRLVAEALAAEDPDIAVNVGDLVTNGRNPIEWREEFFEPAASLLRTTPTYVAIGNHEHDDDLFYELFDFPGRENWYAVTYGCMRLIVLDTNQPVRPGSPQHDWLLSEIESDEFNSATWKIAAFHHPPFSEGWDNPDYDGEPAVRQHLWPVLRDADVDILLMGHTHDYERGELDGVVHVITGGGGSALDHWVQNWNFIQTYDSTYQYCTLDISPERIQFRSKAPDGRLVDEFELTR